ncbi:unnamed protein product, partial [Soboliphyme baturini]|uniref:Vacuolar protein sorting-associated protein 18 homolog n=1 Tax=Soboliphyme baturini TaxID=241478 RepID=A0A183J907_9BILA
LNFRNVWKYFLAQNDFISARKYAASNRHNLDVVLKKQADQLFEDKKFVAAAEIYAMTQTPFEEVVLKFLQLDDKNGLKTFFLKKLDTFSPTEVLLSNPGAVKQLLYSHGDLETLVYVFGLLKGEFFFYQLFAFCHVNFDDEQYA